MKNASAALLLLLGLSGAAEAQSGGPALPAFGFPVHCQYNASAPVLASGAWGYIQCDVNGNLKTTGGGGGGGSSAPPATASFGQAKIVTTGTPVALPTITGVNGFIVRSKATNTGVGGVDCAGQSGVTTTSDGTGNGACEQPGGAWSFAVSQIGSVYVNGAAGDVFFVYGN